MSDTEQSKPRPAGAKPRPAGAKPRPAGAKPRPAGAKPRPAGAKPRPAVAKPLPVLDGLAGEFYAWCKRGELRFQRCGGCGTWRHVPREMCAACGSFDWEWVGSSGKGVLFTWTVVERPLHPAFAEAAPYAPAVIEMEEGVRVLSEVIECSPDALEIGMPVEVFFDAVTPEVTLPKFRRSAK